MPSPRTLAILIASLVLLLSVSWAARTYLASQRCQSLGLIYAPGQGCVPPDDRPVILRRELQRS